MWSSEGCTLNEAESSEENVTCDCDHNTAFAIMMDVADVQVRCTFYHSVKIQVSSGTLAMNRGQICYEIGDTLTLTLT